MRRHGPWFAFGLAVVISLAVYALIYWMVTS